MTESGEVLATATLPTQHEIDVRLAADLSRLADFFTARADRLNHHVADGPYGMAKVVGPTPEERAYDKAQADLCRALLQIHFRTSGLTIVGRDG
jgi:hypothetical protein